MKGRPANSTAPILQLPCKKLSQIIQKIDASSLASIALVNSDCCQLARSRQFASVLLDYSPASIYILQSLIKSPNSNKSSLKPCIRHLTVSAHPDWICRRHGVKSVDYFASLDQIAKENMLNQATQLFGIYYIDLIGHIFMNGSTLPNLRWSIGKTRFLCRQHYTAH